jgi:hypothetical protein
MPNVFFDLFNNYGEQQLIQNLVDEAIEIHGIESYYLVRTNRNEDPLYGEDAAPLFSAAYLLDTYIENVQGFQGDGDLFSQFGIQIRDQITFSVSRRQFEEKIGQKLNFIRPREGDVIYFPLNKKIFEIKFVEHEAVFYQLGGLQFYQFKCELIEYTNQEFRTGVDEIDSQFAQITTDEIQFALLTEDGNYLVADDLSGPLLVEHDIAQQDYVLDDSTAIQEESDAIISFDEQDPFAIKL